MKIKYILFVILALSFSQGWASFVVGYASGVSAGSSTNSSNSGGDVFISRKFDYMIACDLKYTKIEDGNYEYFCFNPPKKDEILFMSTIFGDNHWPSKIIYYMGFK
jgi:hypothetical protein